MEAPKGTLCPSPLGDSERRSDTEKVPRALFIERRSDTEKVPKGLFVQRTSLERADDVVEMLKVSLESGRIVLSSNALSKRTLGTN